jgi:hypothetical protein
MTTNESDDTPPAGMPAGAALRQALVSGGQAAGVRVEMAKRTLLDQTRAPYNAHVIAEKAIWAEKTKHIPGLVHQLTGPDSGLPAEIERWESWHLAYVQKLAEELGYLATTAASTIARRDGAL